MKTALLLIIGWFYIFLITGCEKDENNSDQELTVLEGYLFQGEPIDSIHLTKTVSFESGDTIYPPVTDAQVEITWNNIQYELDNIGNGYYSYNGDALSVVEGESYTISIFTEGVELSSTTNVPFVPTGVELSDTIIYVDTTFTFGFPGEDDTEDSGVRVSWNNPDNSYFYVLLENTDTSASDIVFDSGDFPGGGMPSGGMGMFSFRSDPFQGNEYTINSRSLEKYGRHRIKIYRVNQEYADLYENRTQDSRSLSEPLTNVKNGLGIFTAFSYAEAYFYVDNEYNRNLK
jgi:hypothetical protein